MKIELSDAHPIQDQTAFQNSVGKGSPSSVSFLLFEKIPPEERLKMTADQVLQRRVDTTDVRYALDSKTKGGTDPYGENQYEGRKIDARERTFLSPAGSRGTQGGCPKSDSRNLIDNATSISIVV